MRNTEGFIHMRNLIKILFTSLILFSLNNESAFSYINFYQEKPDSLNQIDKNGLKQGSWIIHNNSGDEIAEKGVYISNKKDGVWTSYFENGNIKNTINYINGKPNGEARFYYENGKLRELGNWEIDHWKGKYQYYYESGQLSYDWNYSKYGKREGEQKYFHSNGEKMYEGNWKNGKTDGELSVFNENGELIQKKIFNEDGFAEIKKAEPPLKKASSTHENEDKDVQRDQFKQTGFHTVFNLSGNINKKGFFVKGVLFNGEEYIYNENGELQKVLIFENGLLKDTVIKTN